MVDWDTTVAFEDAAVGSSMTARGVTPVDAGVAGEATPVDMGVAGEVTLVDMGTAGEATSVDVGVAGEVTSVDASVAGEVTSVDASITEVTSVDASVAGEVTPVNAGVEREVTSWVMVAVTGLVAAVGRVVSWGMVVTVGVVMAWGIVVTGMAPWVTAGRIAGGRGTVVATGPEASAAWPAERGVRAPGFTEGLTGEPGEVEVVL